MVLMSRDRPVDWSADDNPMREALCRKFGIPLSQYDPWFDDPVEALAICNGWSGGPICPMRQRCLHRALVNNEAFGVWGGMLTTDRKALKRRFPHNPEAWQWHAPSTTRRPPTPEAAIVEWRAFLPAVAWTPSCWQTSKRTPNKPPAPTLRIETRTSCTPARSAKPTGALPPPCASCAPPQATASRASNACPSS